MAHIVQIKAILRRTVGHSVLGIFIHIPIYPAIQLRFRYTKLISLEPTRSKIEYEAYLYAFYYN